MRTCWSQTCIMNCSNCDKQTQQWRCTAARVLKCYRLIYSPLSLVVPPSPPLSRAGEGRCCVLPERGADRPAVTFSTTSPSSEEPGRSSSPVLSATPPFRRVESSAPGSQTPPPGPAFTGEGAPASFQPLLSLVVHSMIWHVLFSFFFLSSLFSFFCRSDRSAPLRT